MSQRTYGALLSYASIFINLGIALAFTPFLVSHLGQTEFGIFNIVGSFAAYLIVLDMGMNDSVIRYLLKYKTQSNKIEENNFLANTFIFYTLLSFIVLLVGVWLYLSMETFFSKSLLPVDINSLKTMTWIIAASATMTVLCNPIGAYITAIQRFVFLTLSAIVLRILTTIVLVVFLFNGYKAVAVVAVTATMSVFLLLIKIFYAYSKLGMRINLVSFDFEQIIKLLKYSAPIFIVAFTEIIFWKLNNIILGNMIGAGIVAVYAIGMMFHKYFMSFSTAISKVMMPKIILDLDAGADALKMESILTSISRYQAMIIMLILTGIILYGKAFILLWLGIDYIDAYYVMLLTLIPYSLELIGNVRNIFLQVNHLYWYRAVVICVIAIVNIFVTIYAIKVWGIKGAAASTGVAIIIGYTAINFILWLKLKINIFEYLKNLSKGIMPAIIFTLVFGWMLSSENINTWWVLLAHIILYTVFYIIIIRFVAMNEDEKKATTNLLNSAIIKIKGIINAI